MAIEETDRAAEGLIERFLAISQRKKGTSHRNRSMSTCGGEGWSLQSVPFWMTFATRWIIGQEGRSYISGTMNEVSVMEGAVDSTAPTTICSPSERDLGIH